MSVKVRFAPSPTGMLHIGGARTALVNYVFAKSKGGEFLLRIEDTDLERSKEVFIQNIKDGLHWLGIKENKLILQTSNIEHHKKYVQKLLDDNKAYYCDCEDLIKCNCYQERKPKGKRSAVRIFIPNNGSTVLKDLVLGDVSVLNKDIESIVIARSDGTPTYNFAVTIDDHMEGITHIIRGDDHLTNTFKQLHIYNAIGAELPLFGHIPLILNASGEKLSKRHNATDVMSYKDSGYLPSAMNNYLMKLGWSKGDIELITMDELYNIFEINDLNKSSARFDIDKLKSINKHYISQTTNEELMSLLMDIWSINKSNIKYIGSLIDHAKTRAHSLLELKDLLSFAEIEDSEIVISDISIIKENTECLKEQIALLSSVNLNDFNRDNVFKTIKAYCKDNNIKMKDATSVLRVPLCGENVCCASVFDIMAAFGKDKSLNRLNLALSSKY